jgi:uncharacterized membrane protein
LLLTERISVGQRAAVWFVRSMAWLLFSGNSPGYLELMLHHKQIEQDSQVRHTV